MAKHPFSKPKKLTTDDETAFKGWAIVELMGHRKLAGHCSEATIAGTAFLRLDVPSDPPVTQYYGGSAIYCITPTTEDLARKIAEQSRPTPVHVYELPAPRTPTAQEIEDSIERAEDFDSDDGDPDDEDDDHHATHIPDLNDDEDPL